VVENKSGGIIAGACPPAARRRHPILMIAQPDSATPALRNNVPFRLDADFAPVIKVRYRTNVLVVIPRFRRSRLRNSFALLQGHPDKVNFSSGGFGRLPPSSRDVQAEDWRAQPCMIPYRGGRNA